MAASPDGPSNDGAASQDWDINRRMAKFWDPHMGILMLRWLATQGAYDQQSMKEALKSLLLRTAAVEIFPLWVGEEAPENLRTSAAAMREEFTRIQRQLSQFTECMVAVGRERSGEGPASALERKSLKEWGEWWNRRTADESNRSNGDPTSGDDSTSGEPIQFSEDALVGFIRCSRLLFAFGNYDLAKKHLLFYLDYACEFVTEARERVDLWLACLWGLLAVMNVTLPEAKSPEELQAELQAEADSNDGRSPSRGGAMADAYRIPHIILLADELIDSLKQPREKTLMDRTWLLHWAIWPLIRFYFPRILAATAVSVNPRNLVEYHHEWTKLLDWIFSERNLVLISSSSPHLLRYIAVMAILNRQRSDQFRATVEIVSRRSARYSDPFTAILDALMVDCDFDKAQEKLALFAGAATSDYLLAPLRNTLEESARLLTFQTYCRIQKSINIDVIAQRLHMTSETAERWIVNLIRQARLEGKIDSERNRVEIASQQTSVYEQVEDKTETLLARTSVLVQNLARPAGSPPVPTARGGDFAFRQQRRGNQTSFGGAGGFKKIGVR